MHSVARALAGLALAGSAASFHSSNRIEVPSNVDNANHIFNAIHSSMRQWGSSWYHNGMSFFLASVPAGTQFYHGTPDSTRVNGTEWLAFEPQHALFFAHPRGRGPGRPPHNEHPFSRPEQDVLEQSAEDEDEPYGYLHTYSAAKDLRLLYIDGLSAAKTDMGTLDSQDRILFGDKIVNLVNSPHQSPGAGNGPPGETERAQLACEMAQNEWSGRIDGFLRAEAGFEIILCDFLRDVDLVRIGALLPRTFASDFDMFYYKSIAARFDGIGGERVRVNYDHFVTAYTYDNLELFGGDESAHPRLVNISSTELEVIRNDLTNLVLKHDTDESSFDWQSIADMIVTRYSDWLQYLASGDFPSLGALQKQVLKPYIPFIDVLQRNATLEAEHCAMQFIPQGKYSSTSKSIAAKVIHDVSYSICSTLRTVLDDTDLDTAESRLKALIDYLAWTTWKGCSQKCGFNEECFIPIWPFGTVEDRLNPQCRDTQNNDGENYWGGFGGPPPRGRPDGPTTTELR
ncbi:hypothetical protein PISL3812_09154 [Talaromyces islandicus]|uniref:Uncharacterized protein n=1 Tax=Talaromyces islandicus TaxID=28573 RepID=A0A0U1M950_TALIS|nr:hypothetical protein PISL3812_09154 [Talaromyces islandicus]